MKVRAIYLGDARYDTMPVFELRGNKFVCLTDNELQYDIDLVLADKMWIILDLDEAEDGEYYVDSYR